MIGVYRACDEHPGIFSEPGVHTPTLLYSEHEHPILPLPYFIKVAPLCTHPVLELVAVHEMDECGLLLLVMDDYQRLRVIALGDLINYH